MLCTVSRFPPICATIVQLCSSSAQRLHKMCKQVYSLYLHTCTNHLTMRYQTLCATMHLTCYARCACTKFVDIVQANKMHIHLCRKCNMYQHTNHLTMRRPAICATISKYTSTPFVHNVPAQCTVSTYTLAPITKQGITMCA